MSSLITAIASRIWPDWLVRERLVCTALVTVGCLTAAGDLTGLEPVKALGLVTHASPAPRVFTSHEGYETFSPEFLIHPGGLAAEPVVLTPELNALVRGPYNRRNAYGATIAYGPVLASNPATAPMFAAAFRHGFCAPDGIASDVGFAGESRYAITIVPRAELSRDWPLRFEVDCTTGVVRGYTAEGSFVVGETS